MNRKKFERYLVAHGCSVHHHGGGHDMWWNGQEESIIAVPRHQEVKPGIVKSVCRKCDIPPPSEK